MEPFYRVVLDLYKEAIQGSLKEEAINAAQILLAREITKAHIMGESDVELQQLNSDITDLKFQML